MNNLVHARFNPFSELEPSIRFEAEVGKTIAEILTDAPEVPAWFWHSGEVRINGRRVDRGVWNLLRPKLSGPGCPIVITLHPVFHGGGAGSGSTKNIITTVAAIALVAGATLVSGGLLGPAGLGLLGASFAAGGLGANLAAAGLGLAATLLLSTLTPPAPPTEKGQDNQQLSSAGISQNPIRPMQALPIVLGRVRYSPPLIAPPYTTLENGIVWVHAIFGLAGYYSIDTADILLNAVAIDEFSEIEYEVRDGAPSNSVLTICNETVIEKRGQNLLTNFKLEGRNTRSYILVHQDDPDVDLPQWQLFKTAGDADEIRIRLFSGGIQSGGDTPETAFLPIRVEIRERGDVTWLKMPVVHLKAFRLGEQVRKEIRLIFGTPPGGERINDDDDRNVFGVYYTTADGQAFEYNAESYFANTVPTDQIPVMTNYTTSGVTISMSSDTASFRAWQAADSNVSTFGWAPTAGVLPSWIKVDFGTAKTITSYLMSMGLPSGARDWVLEGSNDNAAWSTVATVTGFNRWPTGGSFGPFWFQVDTPGSYRYYRLTITAGTDPSNNIILNDWRLGLTDSPGNNTAAIFASHVNIIDDGVEMYLDTGTFPKGEYEVRVKRGLAGEVDSFNATTYEYGGSDADANFFNYKDLGSVNDRYQVTTGLAQAGFSSEIGVESFETVSADYPFGSTLHQKGVAMIAVRAPGVNLETLSVILESIVPIWQDNVWSTSAASNNPAALARHVLLSTEQNAEALPGELIDEEAFQEFYEFCASEGHEFNGVVDGLSVIEVFRQVLAAGYAAPDWPGYWSVIYEYDRSAETPVQVFTPVNTRGLTTSKSFPRLPHALRPIFQDEADDFNLNEATLVYMDGYSASNATRIEEMNYPGFTDTTKVAARALFDLRQMYLRPARYSFEIRLEGLVCRRGDLVVLVHDVISRYHDFSRIVSIQRNAGNITGLTLESKVNLAVAAGEVDEAMGAVIQYSDRTTTTKAVNEVTLTDTITFVTPFADPGDILEEGMVVGFGVLGSEARRMLVLWYEYVDELTRRITLIDEAQGLHA